MTKISIVTAAYNAENFLVNAINSILGQTYKDFEFILIDDGSEDGTWPILEHFAKKDSRVVLLKNQENIGLVKSLNKGIKISKGQYIARMDADDISELDRLEKQINFLEQNPQIGILGTRYNVIDENGEIINNFKSPTLDIQIRWKMLFHNAFCHGSIIIKKNILNNVGVYNEKYKYSQDYELWGKVLKITQGANLQEPLYNWRNSGENISVVHNSQQNNLRLRISNQLIEELGISKNIDGQDIENMRELYYLDKFKINTVIRCFDNFFHLYNKFAQVNKKTGYSNFHQLKKEIVEKLLGTFIKVIKQNPIHIFYLLKFILIAPIITTRYLLAETAKKFGITTN